MTTIFIWNNNMVTSRFASKLGYDPASKKIEGHASLNIDSNFALITPPGGDGQDFTDNKKSYVSWIPNAMKRHHLADGGARISHGRKEIGVGNRNFFADLLMEKYAPDHIIRIPNTPKVVQERMRKEWQVHLHAKDGRGHTYDFNRKNCSRVVSRVLRAGWGIRGGGMRYGQAISGIWTPLMVKRLAMSLKGQGGEPAFTISWREFIEELYSEDVVTKVSSILLRSFRKRASNRGSSGADPRFQFEGSWKDRFRGKGVKILKESDNFPIEVLVYLELRERGWDDGVALDVLVDWLNYTMNGSYEEVLAMAHAMVAMAKKQVLGPGPPEYINEERRKRR